MIGMLTTETDFPRLLLILLLAVGESCLEVLCENNVQWKLWQMSKLNMLMILP